MLENQKKYEINDLFVSNKYKLLFEEAQEKNRVLQETNNTLKSFYKLLNMDSLKEIIANEQMESFLDALVPFLESDTTFTENEKRLFLNGCENILLLNSLLLNKFEYAQYLNKYRIDKNIYINRVFLFNRINEDNYKVVENLANLSTNVNFENGKLIKILYLNLCREYELIKNMIINHDFDINEIGDLGLEKEIKGNFFHVLLMMADPWSNKFFQQFMIDFGSKVNLDVALIDTDKRSIEPLDMLMENEKLELTEKFSRLIYILNFATISVKNLEKIFKLMTKNNCIVPLSKTAIFDLFFTNNTFNSSEFNREAVVNKLIELDSSKEVKEEMENNKHNSILKIIEKFYNLTSQLKDMDKSNPLLVWLKMYGNEKKFNKELLIFLLSKHKDDINNFGLDSMKLSNDVLEIIVQETEYKTKQKFGLFSKTVKPKESVVKNNVLEKNSNKHLLEKDIIIKQNTVQKENGKADIFARIELLVKKIEDKEILKLANEVIKQITIGFRTTENSFIKETAPKLFAKMLENYVVYAMSSNKEENRKNTVKQLYLLLKNIMSHLKSDINA